MSNGGADKARMSFMRLLLKHCGDLKKIKPRQMCIFNVIANHGSYQVVIGPEYSAKECENMGIKAHSRKISIHGSLHHLFVTTKRVRPAPEHEDIRTNLRGSVIMKDISVHITDPDGEGEKVRMEKPYRNDLLAKRNINLAGERGKMMLRTYNESGFLIREAYKIIQEDILKAIKPHK